MSQTGITRRQFLKGAVGVAVGGAAAANLRSLEDRPALAQRTLKPKSQIGNPLDPYPNRDWEPGYRDQYK